jgi:hypothetical protein
VQHDGRPAPAGHVELEQVPAVHRAGS